MESRLSERACSKQLPEASAVGSVGPDGGDTVGSGSEGPVMFDADPPQAARITQISGAIEDSRTGRIAFTPDEL